MRSYILLFSAFIFAIAVIIAPLSFVSAYFPPHEKNLLSLDVTKIAKSEINVSYQAQIEVENTNLPSGYNTFTVYIPYAIEDERQKVAALYTNITLSNSTFNSTLANCSCNRDINQYLCCEIVQKSDGKKVKITFSVPKGRFNTSYEITEDVKVNNSMSITSLNKTNNTDANITKFLNFDSWANNDEFIKNFTINLTKNSGSDFEKVAKISEWVYNNIEYNLSKGGKFQSASQTFHDKQGVCNHFTNLFLVMCRYVNISARGIAGEIFNETNYISGHAWADVFIDKWYAVDPTFGEIGLVDGGRVGFTQSVSVSGLLYFDMDPTYLSIISWDISSADFGKPNTTEWENMINVTTNYTWTNKTENNITHIANGTLQITANITRLNLSGAITGMISVSPPDTSSLGINVTVCEDGKPLNGYFLIPEHENSTTIIWILNFTNVNLSNEQNYMFPVVVHSLLSNATTVNVTTYPNFIIHPLMKTIESDNFQLNITVRNVGLRDGNVYIRVFLDGNPSPYATDNLFVKGGSNTNFTIINFTNVIGSHLVELTGDGKGFKFFIGSYKGDVNLDTKISLEDALQLTEFIAGAINETEAGRAKMDYNDADNNNITDIFDVVKILEAISQ